MIIKISKYIKTRSPAQVRTHAQKYVIKLCKDYNLKIENNIFKSFIDKLNSIFNFDDVNLINTKNLLIILKNYIPGYHFNFKKKDNSYRCENCGNLINVNSFNSSNNTINTSDNNLNLLESKVLSSNYVSIKDNESLNNIHNSNIKKNQINKHNPGLHTKNNYYNPKFSIDNNCLEDYQLNNLKCNNDNNRCQLELIYNNNNINNSKFIISMLNNNINNSTLNYNNSIKSNKNFEISQESEFSIINNSTNCLSGFCKLKSCNTVEINGTKQFIYKPCCFIYSNKSNMNSNIDNNLNFLPNISQTLNNNSKNDKTDFKCCCYYYSLSSCNIVKDLLEKELKSLSGNVNTLIDILEEFVSKNNNSNNDK